MASKIEFDWWLSRHIEELPIVNWSNDHTKIAVAFAAYYERMATNHAVGEALNSGDGTYKP